MGYQNTHLLRPMKLRGVIGCGRIIDESFTKNINRIVDFIKAVQRDSVYVGCDYGINATNIAMYLNYFLNPSAFYNSEQPITPYGLGLADFDDLLALYDEFTPEQKSAMGWTEEFEQESRKEAEKERDCFANY